MNKVKSNILKTIISLLCIAGFMLIWGFLDYISRDNAMGIGLGDFILIEVGICTVAIKIRNMIWRD